MSATSAATASSPSSAAVRGDPVGLVEIAHQRLDARDGEVDSALLSERACAAVESFQRGERAVIASSSSTRIFNRGRSKVVFELAQATTHRTQKRACLGDHGREEVRVAHSIVKPLQPRPVPDDGAGQRSSRALIGAFPARLSNTLKTSTSTSATSAGRVVDARHAMLTTRRDARRKSSPPRRFLAAHRHQGARRAITASACSRVSSRGRPSRSRGAAPCTLPTSVRPCTDVGTRVVPGRRRTSVEQSG